MATSHEDVEYYKGNFLLPVFSGGMSVLSPQEVVNFLFGVGKCVPNLLVSSHQPLHVEHNRSFIVDLHSLKSPDDIKCDDCGSWHNLSYNKFEFLRDGDELIQYEIQDENLHDDVTGERFTLKRAYFKLNEIFRKRIDQIHCKYTS